MTQVRADLGRNLTRGLVDRIGLEIVGGAFEDHQFPTEEALASRFGVSRTVTREAMKMLSAKGLIEARPRQGTFIQPVANWNLLDSDVVRWSLGRRHSLRALLDFTRLRYAVDPEAAALAARNLDDRDARAMDAALERMRVGQRCGDDVTEAEIAFQLAILDASKNPFYANFRDVVRTALRHSIPLIRQIRGSHSSADDRAAILDALRAREAGKARLLVRKLIREDLATIELGQRRNADKASR